MPKRRTLPPDLTDEQIDELYRERVEHHMAIIEESERFGQTYGPIVRNFLKAATYTYYAQIFRKDDQPPPSPGTPEFRVAAETFLTGDLAALMANMQLQAYYPHLYPESVTQKTIEDFQHLFSSHTSLKVKDLVFKRVAQYQRVWDGKDTELAPCQQIPQKITHEGKMNGKDEKAQNK